MSDPAVEAAAHAFASEEGDDLMVASERDRRMLIDAAEFALAPIRELHRPEPCCDSNACGVVLCLSCLTVGTHYRAHWPCATARLAFSAEELEGK